MRKLPETIKYVCVVTTKGQTTSLMTAASSFLEAVEIFCNDLDKNLGPQQVAVVCLNDGESVVYTVTPPSEPTWNIEEN